MTHFCRLILAFDQHQEKVKTSVPYGFQAHEQNSQNKNYCTFRKLQTSYSNPFDFGDIKETALSTNILNSIETSHTHSAGMPSVSSIASPEPQILTINDDSNEPTIPYGFGRQLPIVPPGLNDLNLPPNPFNILATMAVVNLIEDAYNDIYSRHSPEPSEPSPISTPPMNVSNFDSWETSHTTTDDNTFYSDDEPQRIFFLPSTRIPPPPPRKLKRKLSLGCLFQKEGKCRSTSAKPADKRSPQQRTSQVHQPRTRRH